MAFLLGLIALVASAAEAFRWGIAAGGALLAVAGALAVVGGRSLVQPRFLRRPTAHDDAQKDRAGAMMSGILLFAMGATIATLALLA